MKANEFRIGLWTIIAIIVLVFGIKFLKGQLHTTTSYYMVCTNVDHVAESSQVTVNGLRIGFVSSMDYDQSRGQVIMGLNIDPDLQIPCNSKAEIIPGLLGNSTVQLTLGDAKTYLNPGDTLAGGDMRPGLIDAAAPIIQSAVPMMDSVAHLIPKIDTLLTGLNILINESKMQESLLQINLITQNLNRTLLSLNQELPAILAQTNEATANLDTVSLQLRQAQVDVTLQKATAAIDSVSALITSLSSTESTAGRLIHTNELHDQLTETLVQVDSLVADIKANPKRYINIKVFGK